MATIVTRAGKGSPLTHDEVDDNFTNLNTDKVETSAIGTAAAANTGDFATAAQGALADTATQPADLATVATTGAYSDLTGKPTLGTAAATASTDYATAAQGTLADSAIQSNDSPTFDGLTVDTDTLHVDATNNRVGIGTSSPSGTMQISATFPTIVLDETDTDAAYQQTQFGVSGGSFRLQTRTSTNAFVSNDYLIDKDSGGATDHIWRIGNSEKMRIDSLGNVGIGTSSPSEALTVIGNGVFGDTTTKYNRITINGGHVGDGDNDYGLTINSFEPAITLLDRSGGAGSGQMRVQSDGSFWFLADTTNDGTIGHNSNTTDSVIAKLESDGTVTATAFAGDGSALTGVGGLGAMYDVQEFTSSGTWTKPLDAAAGDVVIVWGVAGGGGGSRDNNGEHSGGDGGTGFLWRIDDITPLAATRSVTIGAGGAGGFSGNGAAGGSTIFGTSGQAGFCLFRGGSGGLTNARPTNDKTSSAWSVTLSANVTIFYDEGLGSTEYGGWSHYGGGGGGWLAAGGSAWAGMGGSTGVDGTFPGGGGGGHPNAGTAGDGAAGYMLVTSYRSV